MAKLLGPVCIETGLVDVFSWTTVKTDDSNVNRKQAAVDNTVKPLLKINYTFNTHISSNSSV